MNLDEAQQALSPEVRPQTDSSLVRDSMSVAKTWVSSRPPNQKHLEIAYGYRNSRGYFEETYVRVTAG
jgi:hypothetical protein